jgi:putative thioredoxin
MSDTVQATSLATFEQDVLEASRQMPVVVDFWASWCGPCKTLGPLLENVARALAGRAKVVKVDTDAEQQLARQFQIRSIPTVMLFQNGKLASQFVGLQPEHAIREWVTPFLPADEGAAGTDEPQAPGLPAQEGLAEQALMAGDPATARRHLDELPADRQETDRVRGLRVRLYFADELLAVSAGTADLDALYTEGLKAAEVGANGRAAEAFLTLTTRSRAYRDDAGRIALLRLFELLGGADPVVQDYRRRLAHLLH